MSIRTLEAGARGIDCNTELTAGTVRAIADHGYQFVLRYVPRVTTRHGDLTASELDLIRDAGLGVMAVQHVEPGEWYPTGLKGIVYGTTAAKRCLTLGVARGTSVWCDLESVAKDAAPVDVIAFCNQWEKPVKDAGYRPGLYVGWQCGLSPKDLYYKLRVANYWSAYNLNADEFPAVRGVQMRQREAHPVDIPPGVHFPIDVNIVTGDALGGFPVADVQDQ